MECKDSCLKQVEHKTGQRTSIGTTQANIEINQHNHNTEAKATNEIQTHDKHNNSNSFSEPTVGFRSIRVKKNV